jgi:hypothetical protein
VGREAGGNNAPEAKKCRMQPAIDNDSGAAGEVTELTIDYVR